jgi:DNA gyrase subunit B
MRFRQWLKLKIRRGGKLHEMSFTHGVADGAARGHRRYAEGQTGTEVTFLPSPRPSPMIEFDSPRWSIACANSPS